MPTLHQTTVLAALLIATPALAQDAATTQPLTAVQPLTAARGHATASLVSDAKTVVAGRPFTVAVVFAIDPKWHLYWRDPGDSGMPPSVTWTLPPGWTAGELKWPTPAVESANGITNYVYHDSVALLAEITPDAAAKPADAVTLAANLKWLECDVEVCLPNKATVSTPLVVSGTAEPSEAAARFDAWREAVRKGDSFQPPAK